MLAILRREMWAGLGRIVSVGGVVRLNEGIWWEVVGVSEGICWGRGQA